MKLIENIVQFIGWGVLVLVSTFLIGFGGTWFWEEMKKIPEVKPATSSGFIDDYDTPDYDRPDDPEVERDYSTTGDMDCSDFSSQEDAQDFFESEGGPSEDYHNLDRDGDGYVCETL